MRLLILDDDSNRLEEFKKRLIGHQYILSETSKDAINALESQDIFDWCFLDHDLGDQTYVTSGENTGWEVAKWISEHPEKRPKNIILHTLNPNGARAMQQILGTEVLHIPFAWLKIENIK